MSKHPPVKEYVEAPFAVPTSATAEELKRLREENARLSAKVTRLMDERTTLLAAKHVTIEVPPITETEVTKAKDDMIQSVTEAYHRERTRFVEMHKELDRKDGLLDIEREKVKQLRKRMASLVRAAEKAIVNIKRYDDYVALRDAIDAATTPATAPTP